MTMHVDEKLGPIIAERVLQHRDGGAVTVRIGAPKRVGDGDWTCPFSITGADDDRVSEAHGIDSMQALQLALFGIWGALSSTSSKGSVFWFAPDDVGGFQRPVPNDDGELALHIERLIDGAALKNALRAEARKAPTRSRTKTVTLTLSPSTASAVRALSKASGRTTRRVLNDLVDAVVAAGPAPRKRTSRRR